MPTLPIALGMSYSQRDSMPMSPPMPYPHEEAEPEEWYPCAHLELDSEDALPDFGTITFRYRINRETEKKLEGKMSVDVDLLEITAVKGEKAAVDEYAAAGDGLDKIKAELEKVE